MIDHASAALSRMPPHGLPGVRSMLSVPIRYERPCAHPYCGSTVAVFAHPCRQVPDPVYCAPSHRKDAARVRAGNPSILFLTVVMHSDHDEARRARCPRPDKIGWNTEEAAWQSVKAMRSNPQKYPDGQYLNAYRCSSGGPDGTGCGAYHVGDRRRHPDDPVMARWGPQETREDA